jgi:hypothetical protein
MLLVLASMVLALGGPPNVHAQGVADDVSIVDGGGLPTPAEIASHVENVPTPKAIIDRIVSANQHAPQIASMDFVASLRVRRPLAAAPNCVFDGTMKFHAGRRSATVKSLTPGLLCLTINRTIINKLFEGNEPFATLLARFDFQMLGEKVVDGRQYYLVQGEARKSTADPKAMIGWIDYDRGLVIDATMRYAAGAIDVAQNYTSVNSAWMLTYQYVDIAPFGATVEISYSKIRLAPTLVSRVPSEDF